MDQNITEEDLKKMTPEEMREFQKKQCIFCHIIEGKIPSKKVYEDDKIIAILDINPATPGHVLVMPKEHYMIMPQMAEEDIKHIYITAKVISQAQLRGLSVEGTNVFIANGYVAGQKAQHFMLHVIPRLQNDGLNFNLKESTMPRETLEKYRMALGKRLSDLMGVEFKRPETQKAPAVVQQKIESRIPQAHEDEDEEENQEEQEVEGEIEEIESENQTEKNGNDLDKIASLFTGRSFTSQRTEHSEDEDDKQDETEAEEESEEEQEDDKEDEENSNDHKKTKSTSHRYVASIKSTKFHTLNCPFVKRIPLENREYFDSKIEAEKKHERCNCVD